MAFKVEFRVFVEIVVLLCCLCLANCKPLLRPSSCNPRDGLTGSARSVVIRVQRFDHVSVNFEQGKPRLLSTVHHTIPKDGKVYLFGKNLKAKFYGQEVCFSAVKQTISDEKGAYESKTYSCGQVCLKVGTDHRLVTKSSSGGRVYPGQNCCVWTREVYYKLTLMPSGPRCLQCQGSECLKENITTKKCPPGDKCIAVTLNQQDNNAETNSSIVPIMLGCSSDDSLRGYSCKDGCRREVKLVGSGTRKVCVRCCTGDKCNKNEENYRNETETVAFADPASDSVAPNSGSFDLTSDKRLVLIPFMLTFWFFSSKLDFKSQPKITKLLCG